MSQMYSPKQIPANQWAPEFLVHGKGLFVSNLYSLSKFQAAVVVQGDLFNQKIQIQLGLLFGNDTREPESNLPSLDTSLDIPFLLGLIDNFVKVFATDQSPETFNNILLLIFNSKLYLQIYLEIPTTLHCNILQYYPDLEFFVVVITTAIV